MHRDDYKAVLSDLEALRRTPVARSSREAFGTDYYPEKQWEKREIKVGEYGCSVFGIMFWVILPLFIYLIFEWV